MKDIAFDIDANVATLGGRSLVFHCHHYNATLQKTIEETLGDDANELLTVAAQEVVRKQLDELRGDRSAGGMDAADVVRLGQELFKMAGFGVLDASQLGGYGGTVVCPSSHYALGWLAKFGERDTPACEFVTGFVGAVVCTAWGHAPERVKVVESRCAAMGHERCQFDVEVR